MNYKLILSYDGTGYTGWARQPEKTSLADAVHKAFYKSFGVQAILTGASRTDAGVHALGQVMLLKTELPLKAHDIKNALNNVLPEAILVRSAEVAPNGFHPFYNVEHKVYWYHVFAERPLPFVARYGWYFEWPFDVDKLQECLRIFEGTHDFRSFSTGWEREDTVRTIKSIRVTYIKRYAVYRIEIVGQKFLQHMIRRIVGACVKVAATKELSGDTLRAALATYHPRQSLPNAPAQGLLLHTIRYKGDEHESQEIDIFPV